MQTAQPAPARIGRLSLRRWLWATLLTAITAAAANSLIYIAVSALGGFPQSVVIPASGQPMTAAPVAFTSVVGVLGAAVVLAVLAHLVRRPVRWFRAVAIIVLVLSFATPFTIPGAPWIMVVALLFMHVVAWALSTSLLPKLSFPKQVEQA